MAIEPAAISARPAVTMIPVEWTAPVRPAARANGTVNPSDIPITMSRTTSLEVKWRSMWGVWGIEFLSELKLVSQHQHANHYECHGRNTFYPNQRHIVANNAADDYSQARHCRKCD